MTTCMTVFGTGTGKQFLSFLRLTFFRLLVTVCKKRNRFAIFDSATPCAYMPVHVIETLKKESGGSFQLGLGLPNGVFDNDQHSDKDKKTGKV